MGPDRRRKFGRRPEFEKCTDPFCEWGIRHAHVVGYVPKALTVNSLMAMKNEGGRATVLAAKDAETVFELAREALMRRLRDFEDQRRASSRVSPCIHGVPDQGFCQQCFPYRRPDQP